MEDVDAGVMGNFKESTKVMRGETDADDLLKGDWQSLGDREWSVPHAKLLYLIYFHSTASTSVTTPDTWIRHPHLIVLINEVGKALHNPPHTRTRTQTPLHACVFASPVSYERTTSPCLPLSPCSLSTPVC